MSIYERAKITWSVIQQEQIKKGLEKYGKPLNPADWTSEQLLNHAVQENVDQMHYMTALYEKLFVVEMEVQKLRRENGNLKQYFVELDFLAKSDIGKMFEKLATLAKHAQLQQDADVCLNCGKHTVNAPHSVCSTCFAG